MLTKRIGEDMLNYIKNSKLYFFAEQNKTGEDSRQIYGIIGWLEPYSFEVLDVSHSEEFFNR